MKIKSKSKQSEESTDALSSINFFKNRKVDVKTSTNTEILPTVQDKGGSDQSMWRTTSVEISNLYQRVKSGQILKKTDKDEYLPSRFLGTDNKWFLTPGMKYIEGLHLDLMISEIFLEISKKQILNDKTIHLLIQCIDSLDGLEWKILGGPTGRASAIMNYSLFLKAALFPLHILQLLKGGFAVNEDDISERLTSKLNAIRINAISAIYNCMTRNKGIITDERLNHIQKYIDDDEKEFKNWIIQILVLIEDNKNVDYAKSWTSLQKKSRINDQSIDCLVKALDSKDKQTCILAAKALYLASETHEIKDPVLFELQEHIESRIHDVSVYLTVAYVRGLATLSSSYGFIATSHVSYVPRIFVFEDLQLGEENFADKVNKEILFLLYNEAANNPFEDDVFRIFDHILLLENEYQVEAIEILRKYSANKFLIPDDTVSALENVVTTPELFNQVFQVIENIIHNKQIIIDKILDKFFSIKNSFIMEQYLSVMCSVIEKKDYFATDRKSLLDRILRRNSGKKIIARIQTAFVHALKIDNPDVIRKAINGLKILVCRRKVVPEKEAIDILLNTIIIIPHVQTTILPALKIDNQDVIRKCISRFKTLISFYEVELEEDIIDILLSLSINDICDETIRQHISMLLNASKLEENQKYAYELAYLNFDTND
ncbi:unnamed protein product [Rotaria sp. Silwood2]|nr:unnamed protein product [Rotaria sp. Silwood2]